MSTRLAVDVHEGDLPSRNGRPCEQGEPIESDRPNPDARDGPADYVGRIDVDIETETVIARPPDTVSSYAADPLNAPEWYVNIDSFERKTPPPLQVGSQIEFVARFLGRTLRYTYEVVELVPGQSLVMRTQQGPFPMETTYTWEPERDGSTRMTLRNRGEPAGFSTLMAPLMRPAMRRANRKDLSTLKAILESQPR